MRVLKYEDVKKVFEKNGCELLENTYKNNSTKMKFKCSCGRIDYKHYNGFKRYPKCRQCGVKNSRKQLRPVKKFTYDEVKDFVENNSECILISDEYKNNCTKMNFKCSCGNYFTTTFAKFKDRNKRCCNKCSREKQRNIFNYKIDEVKSFIEKNSECTLLSNEYVNNSEPLEIMCGCGKLFITTFSKFKDRNKRQCYDCGIKNRADSHRFKIEKVKNIIEFYGCKLLSREYINAKSPIHIKCKCGEEFYTTLEIFQMGKNRCDFCTSKQSKLERTIEDYLIKCQIKYEKEYRFEDCRNEKPLPFDFAIFDDNKNIVMLIEADGIQHFQPIDYFGGESYFLEQLKRDRIKNEYCKKNNIPLIRIPHYKEHDVQNILEKYFSTIIPSQA